MYLCTLCGPPTAFTSNQLIATVTSWADNHWLDHPARGDGSCEFGKRRFIKMATRLIWMWGYAGDRQHSKSA